MYVLAYTAPVKRYDVEVYQTEDGTTPFQEWLDGIKDKAAKTHVVARISRAALGNFGDWKALTGASGIYEMRIHQGQGFRIFYTVVGQTIILLLAGSTKRNRIRQ